MTTQELRQISVGLMNGVLYYDVRNRVNVISLEAAINLLNQFCQETEVTFYSDNDNNRLYFSDKVVK